MPMAFVKKVPGQAAKTQVTSQMPVPKMGASPTLDPWSMRVPSPTLDRVRTREFRHRILVSHLARTGDSAAQMAAQPLTQALQTPMEALVQMQG
jgi:alpha-beta hydrolase superfamily lysophospholipase